MAKPPELQSGPTDPNEASAQLFGIGRLFGRGKLFLPAPPLSKTPAAGGVADNRQAPGNRLVPATAPQSALTAAAASPRPVPTAAPAASAVHPISKWMIWGDTTVPLVITLPDNAYINCLTFADFGDFVTSHSGVIGLWVGATTNGDAFWQNGTQRVAETIRTASQVRIVTLGANFAGFSFGPIRVWVSEERLDPFGA